MMRRRNAADVIRMMTTRIATDAVIRMMMRRRNAADVVVLNVVLNVGKNV